jgi:hypothetical protein
MLIAKILGFSAVEYESGTFFNRAINELVPGFQADIVFIRKDLKVIVGEVKYGNPPASVVQEVKEKTRLFQEHFPKYRNYTFERLLITASSEKISSRIEEEFDHVIDLDKLFS